MLLVKEANVVMGMTELCFKFCEIACIFITLNTFLLHSKCFVCFLSLCRMSLLSLFLTSANGILSFSNL